jgi:murein DD-endopeptidase MepM/ murein hydrolase activator NlpD
VSACTRERESVGWLQSFAYDYLAPMTYPYAPALSAPLKFYYSKGDRFGKRCTFDGKDWGIHLGEDYNCSAGTEVCAIGRGKVVYAAFHNGVRENPEENILKWRNWGGVVILGHRHAQTNQTFFSIYGHLGMIYVEKGEMVEQRSVLGKVGSANTPENGLWEEEHLHLGIYTGPWRGKILPGYFRGDQKLTRRQWWRAPSRFIQNYRKV